MRNIFTLLFVMISALSNAQWSRLQLGIEGGYNISKIRAKNLYILEGIHGFKGFSTGFSIQYKLTKYFSIKTGAFFYNRVVRFENIFTDATGSIVQSIIDNRSAREFAFPIIPMLHVKIKPKSALYAGIGPTLFYQYNIKLDNSLSPLSSIITPIDRIIFGLHAGMGYSYLLSKRLSLNFEFRDVLSIQSRGTQRLKLNSICFVVGLNYNIDFKNKAKE